MTYQIRLVHKGDNIVICHLGYEYLVLLLKAAHSYNEWLRTEEIPDSKKATLVVETYDQFDYEPVSECDFVIHETEIEKFKKIMHEIPNMMTEILLS